MNRGAEPEAEPEPAPGSPAEHAASVNLRAPRGCGTTAELKARIERRSTNIVFVDGAEPPHAEIHAVILRDAARRLRASLYIRRPSEPSYERLIAAPNCDEALEALAFMSAVVLDPEGIADAPPPDERNRTETSASRPEPEDTRDLTNTDTDERSTFVPFLGAGLQLLGAAAPRPLWGPELTGGLGWWRDSVWSPTLRLSLGRAARSDLQQPGGTASFSLSSATLEVCPLLVEWGPFAARPCAFGSVGQLRAEGTDTVAGQTVERPWWVVGGALLLTWQPATQFRLLAALRGGRAGVRDRFAFEPAVFHEVPFWVPSGSIGAEVLFP